MGKMKKYDSYKDSGIEWIGQIPSHWDLLNLQMVSKDEDRYSFTGGPFGSDLKFEDYTEQGVRIIQLQNIGVGQFNDEYKIFTSEEKADKLFSCNIFPKEIIIAKMAEPVARACFIPTDDARYLMASDGIRLAVNENEFDKRFIVYTLNSNYFRFQAELNSTGSTRLRIGLNTLKKLKITSTSKSEQTAIANYLDQKTAQIDDLIAKKERLIQLLEEERTAIINQAVTKGLDPTVPMKDSGIDWLGEIPEHWEVKKLKYVANLISQKISEKPEYIIALENIESWTGKIIGNPLENEMQGEAQLFDKGDVLFNKLRPYLAKVTLAENMGGAMGELLILRPNEFITSEFLFQRLRSEMIITVVDGSTYGTKMPRASWDKFISLLEFGVPTMEEQNEIVEFICNNELTIDSITQKYQQEIELLKEYKTALISEVVTGKVDVRDEKLN